MEVDVTDCSEDADDRCFLLHILDYAAFYCTFFYCISVGGAGPMWSDTQLRNYASCGGMTSNQLGQLEKLFFDRDSGGHSDNSEVHTVTESRHVMDLPAPCQHSRPSITVMLVHQLSLDA